MGFVKEGVSRFGYRLNNGELVDAGIYGALRSECRFIPKEYRHMKDEL